jgi:cell wall-associated NlpC family hydrolase
VTYRLHDPATKLDSSSLYARTLRQQQRRKRFSDLPPETPLPGQYLAWFRSHGRNMPARVVLHLLVALLVPLAAVGGPLVQQWSVAVPTTAPVATIRAGDLTLPVAPLSLNAPADAPVPNSAFAEIDALPATHFDPRLLQVHPVAATVAVQEARVRTGPGSNYDESGKLAQNTALTLLARHDDWYKAQQQDGSIIWVAAELLSMNQAAADLLPDATDIPAPPPEKVGTVAEDNLNLRDGPGTNFIGMSKLNAGTNLDLLARYGDWLQVHTDSGRTGWVLSQHLNLAPGVLERVETVTSIPDANPNLVGSVSEQNVTLRSGPGTAYDKMGALGAGMQLELLARYDDWYKVRTSRGTTGWISTELVNVDDFIARRVSITRTIPALPQKQVARPQAAAQSQAARPQAAAPQAAVVAPPPAPSAAGGSATGFAMQFVGYPYVWGGEGPRGFDCSGFTRYVYRQYGLNLPHSAAGQFSTAYGAIVSRPSDLQPGDLVFFANTYTRGISHVGIYVGGGNVVQALTPGLGVGVANLNGGYWAAHYYAGLRPRT